ncbi:hypothetical protein G6O69_36205 [Pseudenhygromyxa sp. WMMC2535]|uniref:hypothetical protein n=1 Tax=Pseudenhygromyxa sp. WMMC2535 TaxID=2712867 RepID=UPI0015545192|nr:hypothetical protein [Pseudenhygromyxa sp. WMMC2535]NVB43325.1 hypothetical protein [Pseudenhygromyxa sp. WMMC2535]
MWLLEGHDELSDAPASLARYDAEAQLEWRLELDSSGQAVDASSLLYHEGALYLALRTRDDSGQLILERRALSGATTWTRSDYAPPATSSALRSARLIGVSGSTLAMVATPPLTDYGPSYPLSVDIETGAVQWSGEDGHDPLTMTVGDAHVYLGWVRPPTVELADTTSSLSLHAPSSGAQISLGELSWPELDWNSSSQDPRSLVSGWMGAQLVTILASAGAHGYAIHDVDGERQCQGSFALEFVALQAAVGIEGRSQLVAQVSVTLDDEGDVAERGLLVIEPGTKD